MKTPQGKSKSRIIKIFEQEYGTFCDCNLYDKYGECPKVNKMESFLFQALIDTEARVREEIIGIVKKMEKPIHGDTN